jgi:hypothetical protein
MRYRKKPIVIEAVQFDGSNGSKNALMKLMDTNFIASVKIEGVEQFTIETLEGNMTATEGDYIIKGVKGEIYPCKPDIFEMTYEKV